MRRICVISFVCLALAATAPADAHAASSDIQYTIVNPPAAPAQTSPFVPLANYGNSKLGTLYGNGTTGSLPGFLNAAFAIALSIGAMAAVLRLVYAGYIYMVSDLWTSKGRAKEIIGNTILGILLLLGVYLILYQINPCILSLDIMRDFNSSSGQWQNNLQCGDLQKIPT